MTVLPDEELPGRLDAAEGDLATAEHRWFARATLFAALATGVALLLPWTYSRRLGLSVWQLGIETEPTLAFTWLAGLATTVIGLLLKPGPKAQATAAVTTIITLLLLAATWQASNPATPTDTWTAPGPAVALATSLTWLLTTLPQFFTPRSHPATPSALARTVTRLRRTR
jgi:hypothetical protein